MRERFLEFLCCPECGAGLALGAVSAREGEAIVDGELRCRGCSRTYAIRGRVVSFVEGATYADNFGWQWKRFAKLQRDSYNGSRLVRDTIFRRAGWCEADLAGKRVLECGCGSGSDSEVLAAHAGTLVSADLSASVEAFAPELLARDNVLVLRADLHHLPLRPQAFDVVYCHRVIMHTPEPAAAFAAMAPHVAPGGSFLVHSYDTHWKSRLHFRYWLRPLIRRVPHTAIFRALRVAGPILYPLVGLLNRIGLLRRPVKLLIPFENHDRILTKAGVRLTRRERYEYSLLVTFDALTPRHDHPSPPEVVASWFERAGLADVVVRSRNPVIALGRRATHARSAAASHAAPPAPTSPTAPSAIGAS